MTSKQPKTTSQVEPTQELERIRDIIFGSQMRDYDGQFQTIQRDQERLQQEIDRLTEQLANQDSDQGKKLQSLRREMRKSDDGLRKELRETAQKLTIEKVDRAALGELFIELGTRLKTGGSLADLLKNLGETEQD